MRHHDGTWLDEWQAIEVDAGSVRQLAAALVTETQGNLEPGVGRVYEGYAPGTTFGRSIPSVELHAVRARYNDCLEDTVAQLAAYVAASSVLVAAAIEIAFRYRSVDELAGARIEDIDQILSRALVAAQPGQDFGHDVAAGLT
jgi:hypothetical protein